MANLVLSSSADVVTVDYGIYGGNSSNPFSKGSYPKVYLKKIELESTGLYVFMVFTDGSASWLTFDTAYLPPNQNINGFDVAVVDPVDGVAPTSNSNLFDLIVALL